MLHGLAQCCVMLHGLAQCCVMLHGLAQCCVMLHSLAQCCVMLHSLAQCCVMLHGLAQCCVCFTASLSAVSCFATLLSPFYASRDSSSSDLCHSARAECAHFCKHIPCSSCVCVWAAGAHHCWREQGAAHDGAAAQLPPLLAAAGPAHCHERRCGRCGSSGERGPRGSGWHGCCHAQGLAGLCRDVGLCVRLPSLCRGLQLCMHVHLWVPTYRRPTSCASRQAPLVCEQAQSHLHSWQTLQCGWRAIHNSIWSAPNHVSATRDAAIMSALKHLGGLQLSNGWIAALELYMCFKPPFHPRRLGPCRRLRWWQIARCLWGRWTVPGLLVWEMKNAGLAVCAGYKWRCACCLRGPGSLLLQALVKECLLFGREMNEGIDKAACWVSERCWAEYPC